MKTLMIATLLLLGPNGHGPGKKVEIYADYNTPQICQLASRAMLNWDMFEYKMDGVMHKGQIQTVKCQPKKIIDKPMV
jgi:hypothetical protein